MGIRRDTFAKSATSSRSTETLTEEFGQLHVLDDLIRLRAEDDIQTPILAYPSSNGEAASYTYYTGQQMDRMIDETAKRLMEDGFRSPKPDRATVGLLTLSDLNMVITIFALSRLGYTVMILSPHLSGDACVALLNTVGCDNILYGNIGSIRTTMGEVLQRKLIACRPMPALNTSPKKLSPALHRNRNPKAQRDKIALILHSSGSTGNPKPLYLTHRALMTHPLKGPGMTSFNPLPWYHLHGISTALQAMWMRKTAFMWNASLPLTADSIVTALQEARPEYVAAVPYMLQMLVDSPRGIEALRGRRLVGYGGAPCPDELGDRLVREGVSFGGSFGLTEAGLVAESISRPKGDPYWNYLKFFETIQPYVWMKPLGSNLFECVYLAGHPALTTSNSDDPPGSFHSKDVFTPHPSIPQRWKHVSRIDDRITLTNGEKVLPLPIEGCIKQSHLIQEAVVVGLNKSSPGLLVFRSQEADEAGLSEEEYFAAIWPTIELANSRAEHFSRIAKDMIAVLPSDSKFPRTDKGSMIREQVNSQYAELIERIYSGEEKQGGLRVGIDETRSVIMDLCQSELGVPLSGAETSFFSEGVDSLKAIHLRRLILQSFELPKEQLPQNVVYDTGSVARLAEHICAAQSGKETPSKDDNEAMLKLIQKYSTFSQHTPCGSSPSASSAILTGATGSIGAHTLYELLNDESISTVFCLTRRKDPLDAILRSLSEKDLHITPEQASNIVALNSALEKPDFGLDEKVLTCMRQSVTQIYHVAWPVNFNLPLGQFEPHLRGLYNLLQFSLLVQQPQPAVVMFCSSVSTALNAKYNEIPEEPLDLDTAYMGYGQSKLAGEHIVSAAHQSGARAYSLRIGQVSGHSKNGVWNDTEALPLMIRSAGILKALPDLSESCSWLPVDDLASAMLELARSRSQLSHDIAGQAIEESIYNVCNSHEFTWSALLESVGKTLEFEVLPFEEWVQLLRKSEARGEELGNPAVKLIDHYEAMHGSESDSVGVQSSKKFLTERSARDSPTLRNGRPGIIEDGVLDRYMCYWMSRWERS
ncbi:unnamed protein product [Penicillium olsonii]|nr:unnamed protein product [Penicillium olsonii]